MALTRRGFLGTMFAAAAGAVANFDPIKKLWVPGRVAEGDPEPAVIVPNATWTKAVVDEQLELNDLALRFARIVAPRLERQEATIFRTMMLREAGHVGLGLITLTDDDGNPVDERATGMFSPVPYRIVNEAGSPHRHVHGHWSGRLADAADQMRGDLRKCDAFAPIGTHLRDGVPFADCLVGVATDPESGLSARVLRYKTVDGLLHTDCEIAGGEWDAKRRRIAREETRRALLATEFWAQEARWQAENGAAMSAFEAEDAEGFASASKSGVKA